jgi:hypothetical protein
VEPVVTLESMPLEAAVPPEAAVSLEAVMALEAVMTADATVRPAEGVPTATAVASVRVHGRAADEERCCDQCAQPN